MNIGGRAGAHAAPRHGRRARPGALGPYETLRRDPRGDPRGRPRVRPEPCGARAYPSNTLESGWIPSPLPAIYTGEELRGYREWLAADSYEATGALAGSFVSDDIEDYYLNPWELGYGPFVKFDHDFIGREALEQIDPEAQRKKVTLAWNADDVAKIFASLFDPDEDQYQFFDLPIANYGSSNYDSVLDADGDAGRPVDVHRLQLQRAAALSLATIDPERRDRRPRSRWSGASRTAARARRRSSRTSSSTVSAIVSPVPYSEVARLRYAEGWRTAGRR